LLQSVPSETFGCLDEFIGYDELLLGICPFQNASALFLLL